MTEYEVKRKLEETISALDEYKKNLIETKGIWHDDIQKLLPVLTEKSHVLNASGQVCPSCKGSGRL